MDKFEKLWNDAASSWGSKSNAAKKDPQRKRVPRTWGKKRVNSDPRSYQKKMS